MAIFVKSSSQAAVLPFKELLFQFSTENFLMKPLLQEYVQTNAHGIICTSINHHITKCTGIAKQLFNIEMVIVSFVFVVFLFFCKSKDKINSIMGM